MQTELSKWSENERQDLLVVLDLLALRRRVWEAIFFLDGGIQTRHDRYNGTRDGKLEEKRENIVLSQLWVALRLFEIPFIYILGPWLSLSTDRTDPMLTHQRAFVPSILSVFPGRENSTG